MELSTLEKPLFEPVGLGKTIFQDRYARSPEESWTEACMRVSQHVAQAESNGNVVKYTNRFFQQLADNKFNPGGRIWYGSGRPKAQLLNCFVIDTNDTREGWGKTTSDVIVISGLMGGVGMNMSPIRPRGSLVHGTGGIATGAVSLMQLINGVGDVIVGGGGRRMALMLCLNINHPDVEEFLNVKLNLKELNNANISVVIPSDMPTEDFVAKVRNGDEIELIFNGIPSGKTVNAHDLWDILVKNAWNSGEPGVLNGYLANKMSNIGYYAELTSTNPCFRGDTLIATADGRGSVAIEQLAAEGKDVPVYSMNGEGKVEIKWGRNPRLTRTNTAMVEVVLDSGNSVFVTPDHKFILRNGEEKQAKDLAKGDSLPRFTKRAVKMSPENPNWYSRINCDVFDDSHDKIMEHRLIAQFHDPQKWEEVYNISKTDGWCNGGLVVHHKDFDSLNNSPLNLQIMSFNDHRELHAQYADMSGSKNPMWGRSHSEVSKSMMSTKRKLAWNDDDYRARNLETRKSPQTREAYSQAGKKARENSWKTYYLEQESLTDLRTTWINNQFYAIKVCEGCENDFTVEWPRREISYCSLTCFNKSDNRRAALRLSIAKRNAEYRVRLLDQQVSAFLDLAGDLGREPKKKEWEQYCRVGKIPFRFRPDKVDEGALGSFTQLKEVASTYNHRVVAVLPAQSADVYNITVDDNHTVALVNEVGENGAFSGVFTLQCGEFWMSPKDSCCLGALVLPRFVSNKEFDWDSLDESVRLGIRFLDDVLTVNHFPLPEIKETCENLRRIGLGVMGLHSMLLSMGMRYDDPKAFAFVDKLFNTIKNTSYDASINLAIEKGPFPAYEQAYLDMGFIKTLKRGLRNKLKEHGIRNCAVMTVAPTGTTSMVSGVSSSIEPLPPAVYFRNYFRPNANGIRERTTELVVEEAYYNYPDLIQSAIDVPVRSHFEMQKIVQKHVDNAVSKTINLAQDHPIDAFGDTWLEYLPYLKGTTVYRYGSRENEPINPVPRDQWESAIESNNLSLDTASEQELLDLACPSGVCDIVRK